MAMMLDDEGVGLPQSEGADYECHAVIWVSPPTRAFSSSTAFW